MANDYYSFIIESSKENQLLYSFTTEQGVRYLFSFEPDLDGIIDSPDDYKVLYNYGCMIGFECDGENRNDPKIFETIKQIILDYSNNRTHKIVFMFYCDDSDLRQSARARLFRIWLRKQTENFIFYIVDADVRKTELTVNKFHLGYFTNSTNDLLDEAQKEFDKFSYNISTSTK